MTETTLWLAWLPRDGKNPPVDAYIRGRDIDNIFDNEEFYQDLVEFFKDVSLKGVLKVCMVTPGLTTLTRETIRFWDGDDGNKVKAWYDPRDGKRFATVLCWMDYDYNRGDGTDRDDYHEVVWG